MNEPELRFKADDGREFPEWEEKKIEDIGTIVTGTTPSTKIDEYYVPGEYLWVTPSDISDSKDVKDTERKLSEFGMEHGREIEANSVLVTCIASIGKNCILREKGSCNQQINAIKPYPQYDVDFVFYIVGVLKDKMIGCAGQTATVILNKKQFGNIKALFPCLEEQRKIADLFSALDNMIDSVQKEVDSWEQMKRGVMQKLFSQEVRFKADDGSEFPDWTTIKADDLLENIIDRNHPEDTVLTIIQGEGTVPRKDAGRNIQYDKKYLSTYKQVKKNDFIIHLRSFEGGLEIVNETGIVSPAYIILRSKKEIAPGFYNAYFHSNEFIHHNLPKTVEGIRDGRQISYSAFKQLYLPWCCLEEQQKIADCLSEFDSVIEKTKQKLEAYKQLKKGLMQRMFV